MVHSITSLCVGALLVVNVLSAALEDGNISTTAQSTYEECITRDGRTGVCVHESYCGNDNTIEEGGIIDGFELRSKIRSFRCTIKTHWCCSQKDVLPLFTSK